MPPPPSGMRRASQRGKFRHLGFERLQLDLSAGQAGLDTCHQFVRGYCGVAADSGQWAARVIFGAPINILLDRVGVVAIGGAGTSSSRCRTPPRSTARFGRWLPNGYRKLQQAVRQRRQGPAHPL